MDADFLEYKNNMDVSKYISILTTQHNNILSSVLNGTERILLSQVRRYV